MQLMKREGFIVCCIALLALASCMKGEIQPQEVQVPQFLEVSYNTGVELNQSYADLSAKISSSVGIQAVGFMVGLTEASLHYYSATLKENAYSIRLNNLSGGKEYCFYAKADNGINEIRTKLQWFRAALPSSGEDNSSDDENPPVMPPDGEGITISDPYFESWLLSNFDLDNNNKLESKEVLAVSSMKLTTDPIATLDGIQYFANLQRLNCSGSVWNGKLTSLALNNNTKLTSLVCCYNQITSASFPASLEELNIRFNKLSHPNFKGLQNLKRLDCFANNIMSLDLSTLVNLEELTCGLNSFETLNLSNNLKLKKLDLSDSPSLKTVYLRKGQKIAEIIASNNIAIKYLE